MNLQTKYAPGDTVFYITSRWKDYTPVRCIECEGTGKVTTTKGKELRCDPCFGAGSRNVTKAAWQVMGPGIIDELEVFSDGKTSRVRYRLEEKSPVMGHTYFYETETFTDRGSASAACAERMATTSTVTPDEKD